jgi:uncharacterized protein (DUF924 family)
MSLTFAPAHGLSLSQNVVVLLSSTMLFYCVGIQTQEGSSDVKQRLFDLWFNPVTHEEHGKMRMLWFMSNPEFDAECAKFLPEMEAAASGTLDSWAETAEGALALLLLLDQLPRNVFRGQFFTEAPAMLALAHNM